jgi:ligand-binding sensor domain-containing protein
MARQLSSFCRVIAAILLLLVSACGLLAAEDASRHFTIDTWTVDEGLPQNSVLSIAQTGDGYLWLGTLNGLARFDGTRFRVFDENNTPSFNSSRVIKLLGDSADNLWVGTEPGGLYIISPDGRFSVASLAGGRETAGGRPLSAVEDRSGAVWLYTEDGRLGRYTRGSMDVWSAAANITSRTRALATERPAPGLHERNQRPAGLFAFQPLDRHLAAGERAHPEIRRRPTGT